MQTVGQAEEIQMAKQQGYDVEMMHGCRHKRQKGKRTKSHDADNDTQMIQWSACVCVCVGERERETAPVFRDTLEGHDVSCYWQCLICKKGRFISAVHEQ